MKSSTKLLIIAYCNIALQMIIILHSVMMFIDASAIELIFSTEYARSLIFSFVTIVFLNSVLYVVLYQKDRAIKKNDIDYINTIRTILNNLDFFKQYRDDIKDIDISTDAKEAIDISIKIMEDARHMYYCCDRLQRVIYDKDVKIIELENKVRKLDAINEELKSFAGVKDNDAVDCLINRRIARQKLI